MRIHLLAKLLFLAAVLSVPLPRSRGGFSTNRSERRDAGGSLWYVSTEQQKA